MGRTLSYFSHLWGCPFAFFSPFQFFYTYVVWFVLSNKKILPPPSCLLAFLEFFSPVPAYDRAISKKKKIVEIVECNYIIYPSYWQNINFVKLFFVTNLQALILKIFDFIVGYAPQPYPQTKILALPSLMKDFKETKKKRQKEKNVVCIKLACAALTAAPTAAKNQIP